MYASIGWRIVLVSCCFLPRLAAADESADADIGTQFADEWRIVGSEPARIDRRPAQPADERLLGARLVFETGRVVAPAPLGCENARYEMQSVPAQGLFQGTLGETESAARRAESLGLSGTATPTLGVICDGGLFDYHAATSSDGSRRLLIMLNRVIYTLEPAAD